VYKLRKALYGLKQAPRAWYGRLRRFLFERGFEMGKVDQTLFLLRHGRDILIVHVYVDDICDAPGFQQGLLTQMSRVNRVDFGQTTVNLCHHLENIPDNP
jgi:hypothetical protein